MISLRCGSEEKPEDSRTAAKEFSPPRKLWVANGMMLTSPVGALEDC